MQSHPAPPRVDSFASAVRAAADWQTKNKVADEPLPVETLAALLEPPVHVLASKSGVHGGRYDKVELRWRCIGEESSPLHASPSTFQPLRHEASQSFARRLSFGRMRCFRIHRFVLSEAADLNADLADYALDREHGSCNQTGEAEDALHVSNVGGYHSRQDLFAKKRNDMQQSCKAEEAVLSLRRLVADCVQLASCADAHEISLSGEAPPPLPDSDEAAHADPDGWVNVSREGALNYLHHHAGATVATVYYAQVEANGGSLLFRLSPGSGQGITEPQEDRHVSWMWTCDGADEIKWADSVQYAEIQPAAGTLLMFPAWLSHSVAPHFGQKPRVSFASNWDLPMADSEDETDRSLAIDSDSN